LAPAILVELLWASKWGPVTTYDAKGNVVSVEPAKPEPKPKKRRRTPLGAARR